VLETGRILMFEPNYDLEKIQQLEIALLEYVERYGLSDNARQALAQLDGIQSRRQISERSR